MVSRRVNVVLAMLLILSFTVVPAFAAAPTGQPIRIGVVTEVTGAAAMSGDHAVKGVNLALKEINDAGGVLGRPLEIVVEDTQSKNPGAVAAFNKTVQADNVVAVIAPIRSTQIQAMDGAIREAKLVTLMGGTNTGLTEKGNTWLFRFRPPDKYASQAMVQYLVETLKLTKVGIMHDSDAFGTGGADAVEAALKAKGLSVCSRQKYTTADKDYMSQLLSIKNAGCEAMVSYGTNSEDVAIYLRQKKEIAPNMVVMGSPSSVSEVTLRLGGEANEGIYAVTDYLAEANKTSLKFVENYGKAYSGAVPDNYASWMYDALYALSYAITKANGTDPEAMRKAMFEIQDVESVEGTDNCAPNGDCAHTYFVVQVKNAKVVLIAPLVFWKQGMDASGTVTTTTTISK
jgi:branched-chain amino acid transport system substrate-binding protein